MPLQVKLQAFEGPLDLLLHLIDKNKVDIYDIPIVTITEQYLEYISHIESEDMNLMSEFLVIAATLLDIKCRMLLPPEEDEDGEESDPRAELVQKLLEYKMYKYMSAELRDRQVDARRSLFKISTLPDEVRDYREPLNYEELIGDASLNKLHEIFKTMLKRQVDKIDPIRSTFREVQKDEVSMEEKMAYVEAYIEEYRRFSFAKLLEHQKNRMEIIVTFLVVLELMRLGRIIIRQNDLKDDIIIEKCKGKAKHK
jgi:segregation and condensation protein A